MLAAFLLTIFRGVIVLILGESYRGAIRLIPFLSLMPVLSILFEMTGQGCKFVGKAKYFNYASLAAIICNLAGNTLLVPIWGGVGAALATAVTYIVYFLIGTLFSVKCYPVPYRMKKFIISVALYCAYAAYATWTDRIWICALLGGVLLAVVCLMNRKVIASLWNDGKRLLKEAKSGGAK
jgi:O-antigen/teichoic acid export membrane protein